MGVPFVAVQKGVCLTPWEERKMVEMAKDGPLTDLSVNVKLNMTWISTGRRMDDVRGNGNRTSVTGWEAKF